VVSEGAMNYKDMLPMTPERWISNLLEVAEAIADKEHQERRWRAPDRKPWECPDELINVVFDDCGIDLFLQEYAATFAPEQRTAAFSFRDALNDLCHGTPQILDSAATLTDPRWAIARQKAAEFVGTFKGKWPGAA
jgi:hypothetical protein